MCRKCWRNMALKPTMEGWHTPRLRIQDFPDGEPIIWHKFLLRYFVGAHAGPVLDTDLHTFLEPMKVLLELEGMRPLGSATDPDTDTHKCLGAYVPNADLHTLLAPVPVLFWMLAYILCCRLCSRYWPAYFVGACACPVLDTDLHTLLAPTSHILTCILCWHPRPTYWPAYFVGACTHPILDTDLHALLAPMRVLYQILTYILCWHPCRSCSGYWPAYFVGARASPVLDTVFDEGDTVVEVGAVALLFLRGERGALRLLLLLLKVILRLHRAHQQHWERTDIYSNRHSLFFITARKRSCGKAMFSQAVRRRG